MTKSNQSDSMPVCYFHPEFMKLEGLHTAKSPYMHPPVPKKGQGQFATSSFHWAVMAATCLLDKFLPGGHSHRLSMVFS